MKKQIISLALISAVVLGGCGSQESSSSSDEYYTDYFAETTAVPAKEYTCAADLLGEPIADIDAAGFDYDLILNLAEYDPATAKPYTILIDGTYAFAAGVMCKDSAVIINGLDTSPSMDDFDPPLDVSKDLYWSAATNSHYNPRCVVLGNGEKYDVNYMWCPPDPDNIFSVYTNVPSDFAFIYQDSYVYLPDYDFMWFHWGDSIYDVQSALIDKGFKIEDSLYVSNSLTTKSVSETLYGHDFYVYLSYNDNMQFTGGTYDISGKYYELADIFEAAVKDLVGKYGDTYNLYLTNKFTSLDEMLAYMRRAEFIDPYNFKAELKWNVNDRTKITLTIFSSSVEINYKSISSTSGTGMNEGLLI